MRVFVLNQNKQPLDPCQPARARLLLSQGKAKVYRRYPFTIILTEVIENPVTHNHQLKIDPGAKITGLAIVQDNIVIWGAELTHRGFQIRDALTSRRQLRRSRRNRKTRYRKPRFLNRKRPEGWLAPCLMSRIHNILTWVKKLIRFCPVTSIFQRGHLIFQRRTDWFKESVTSTVSKFTKKMVILMLSFQAALAASYR